MCYSYASSKITDYHKIIYLAIELTFFALKLTTNSRNLINKEYLNCYNLGNF